jgi:hypothetical protein
MECYCKRRSGTTVEHTISELANVMGVGCYRSRVHPQVADGVDGLQMWRIASNIISRSRGPEQGFVQQQGVLRRDKYISVKRMSKLRTVLQCLGSWSEDRNELLSSNWPKSRNRLSRQSTVSLRRVELGTSLIYNKSTIQSAKVSSNLIKRKYVVMMYIGFNLLCVCLSY